MLLIITRWPPILMDARLVELTYLHTGLFTRRILLNFYFAATNNTNGSNY
jgi:hypothetical protein